MTRLLAAWVLFSYTCKTSTPAKNVPRTLETEHLYEAAAKWAALLEIQ